MRTIILFICMAVSGLALAQRECATVDYAERQRQLFPHLSETEAGIEKFIAGPGGVQKIRGEDAKTVIRIPVIVHIVYHTAAENIPDEKVAEQISILNRDFRMRNADTTNIPTWFRPFAADTEFEFALATTDPQGRPTTGIRRKYTHITSWSADDRIKFSSEGGSDAWDSRYYLNIWVGNTRSILGYSSSPGAPADRDGIVINISAFGITGGVYGLGRTAVHEAGHWLGLKHIWGDSYCGDDLVEDTPKQGNFTSGCPASTRYSCNNASGDMYMNYMDYTNDACILMFTQGQKERMHAVFLPGGPRYTITHSHGLGEPWMPAIEEEEPVNIQIYPNPARNHVTLVLDPGYIGHILRVMGTGGSVVMQLTITSARQQLDLSALPPSLYFLEVNNGRSRARFKLVKL